MRRVLISLAVSTFVLGGAGPAFASHVPTNVIPPRATFDGTSLLTRGDIRWVSNAQAAHGVAAPLGEGKPFERDGRRYMIASDSIYGLTVVDLTDPIAPTPVSTYASAFGCPTGSPEFLANTVTTGGSAVGGLFNAGLGLVGWENDLSVTPDGMIAVIGTDAPGRCHDPVFGGLEFVDLSDLTNPRPLHLVRNVGFAHSAGIDPYHPWLAYVSTTDGDDFIDVVDFSSCLGGVADIARCVPVVARIPFTAKQYPQLRDPTNPDREIVNTGCHDIRFLATRAYCAAINTTLIIDTTAVAGASAGSPLSGTHLTAGPNACPIVDATRAPGVKVTDCSGWTESAWDARGGRGADAPIISVIVHHAGKAPNQDIDTAHQAEPMEGGRILAITDERGGGLNAGTPACPGGGIWFYDIRDEAHPRLMRTAGDALAVFISANTIPSPFSCTVHYGEQFGGEPILTFAWYTAGTHVVKMVPDLSVTPATIDFEELATIIPVGAWSIQAKPIMRDPADPARLLVYTADAARGLDVFSVAVPVFRAAGARVLNARATTRGSGRTNVLGARGGRLPKTGVEDAPIGFVLLALAAGLATWTRRRTAY